MIDGLLSEKNKLYLKDSIKYILHKLSIEQNKELKIL